MSKKISHYHVYRAAEGQDESFLGMAETLDDARALAATATEGLPASLYETARAAGHVDGLYAPDKSGEADAESGEHEWAGPQNEHVIVPVYAAKCPQ